MPTIYLNRDALVENTRLVLEHCRRYGCSVLPVLKMVQAWPSIRSLLKAEGILQAGIADVDEVSGLNTQSDEDNDVLINLAIPSRAADIVSRFARSVVSNAHVLERLEQAAKRAQRSHQVLLAIDVGDGREGIPLDAEIERFFKARTSRVQNAFVKVTGVSCTLGCLMGLCPDERTFTKLFERLEPLRDAFDISRPIVSIGSSIVWNWVFSHAERFAAILAEHPNWQIELRVGDPFMVGWDVYRDQALESVMGQRFRQDVFAIRAEVLEVERKSHRRIGDYVLNGHGVRLTPRSRAHTQVIADCGRLHTDVSGLRLLLPEANVIDFSGNYAVIDASACSRRLQPGDFLTFEPSYWAVARASRTASVGKKIVSNQEFQELIRCSA